jgi:hypothetical protein
MSPPDDSPDRFDRALRAFAGTSARSLLVAGVSRANQHWPETPLVQRFVDGTGDALAEDGAFVTATLKFGPRVLVEASDDDARQLLFEGELDPPTTRFLTEISWAGWTFLDFGARTGYFSLLARHLGGRTSTVHAFESDAIFGDHIRAATAGVNDHEGIVVLPSRGGARSEMAYGIRGPEVVVSVDHHCSTYDIEPDVIRLRGDGLQIEILEGMQQQLRGRGIRYLIRHSSWRDDAAEIDRFLAGYGYEPHQIDVDGALTAPDGDPSATFCYVPSADERLT